MIHRIRRPGPHGDIKNDIDIGGGEVGRMRKGTIGGVAIAQAEVPRLQRDLDLSQNPRLAK